MTMDHSLKSYDETAGEAEFDSAETSVLLAKVSRATEPDEFAFDWLETQCRALDNVVAAVLLVRDERATAFKPLAKYPLDARVNTLAEVAYGVIDEECGLLVPLDEANLGDVYAVAYPVHVNGELRGIVALEVRAPDPNVLEAVMGQLQWSVGWITLYFVERKSRDADAEALRSRRALAILADIQAEDDFVSACRALVTSLATELDCDRVSLGFPSGKAVRVQAVSHTAEFGRNMSLASAIGDAMLEALLLGRDVMLPASDTQVSAPDHDALKTAHGSDSIVSVPIYVADRFRCVLTLERSRGLPLGTDTVEFVRAVGVLCAPTLEDRQLAQRSLIAVARDRFGTQLTRLTGPNYVGRKLAAASFVALALFFAFATGTYRISAETELEGIVQRVMAAPFDGYIAESTVRAGDLVSAGDVVARLEDEELRLERQRHLSERSQYRHEYNDAYANNERSSVNIGRARMNQASAALALTEQKLARSNIVAPFDGVVIDGDLSQRLGGFVEQGEVLFEIAPLDSYRVILFVEDTRIADVRPGQQGALVLSSMPEQSFRFEVETITPITEAREGANYFRVEARLADGSERLRPGMEGVGKIDVDERRLIAIWTRGFTDWLRLQVWKWVP